MSIVTKRLPALLASVFIVAAAGAASAATPHSLPWYQANPAARSAALSACAADPGDLANTPDCINAEAAQSVYIISLL
jgi:hypothetical protein